MQVQILLTKDTHNNGFLQPEGQPNSWDSKGKLGKCGVWNGSTSNYLHIATTEYNYTDNFSWCGWFYNSNTSTNTSYAFTNGRADANGWGYGLEVSNNGRYDLKFGSSTYSLSGTLNTWIHITFVKEGSSIKIYKNGVLTIDTIFTGSLPTYTLGSGLGLGCFYCNNSAIYPYYGRINDFRIYDYPLSDKQVLEISKGLILHYPLNQDVIQPNLFSDRIEIWNISIDLKHYTATFTLSSTRFYRIYQIGYNGLSGYYTFSCIAVANKETTVDIDNCDSNRTSYTITTTPQYITHTANVTKYNTSSNYNGFIDFQNTTITDAVVTLYNIKVEYNSTATAFCKHEDTTNYIYDCSGLENNGTVINTLALSNNTPRYNYSTIFNSSGIQIADPIPNGTTDFTISFWIKPINGVGCIWNGRDAVEENIGVFYADGIIRFDTNTQLSSSNISTTTWSYITCVSNSSNKYIYINGVLNATATSSVISKTNTIATIGVSSSGSSLTTINYLNGNISDFRIYMTALDQSSITELYTTSSLIDNKYNYYSYMLTESSGTNINSKGITNTYQFNSNIKTLEDGSKWLLVLYHNNPSAYLFNTSNCKLSENNINLYSILEILTTDNFISSDGKYEFLAIQKLLNTSNEDIIRWTQTNAAASTTSVTGLTGTGGLCLGTNTYLAISNSGSNWFGACGCYTAYNGGIPGFNSAIITTGSLQLYIRIDNSKFIIRDTSIISNNIQEI